MGAQHAFLYTNGTMHDLGTLGGSISCGLALNSAGAVTGNASVSEGAQHAFVYRNGQMQDLNSLINNRSSRNGSVTLTNGVAIANNGLILANGIDSRTGQSHAYLLCTQSEDDPCEGK
jgi:probable HAF family extracellular repeat protein